MTEDLFPEFDSVSKSDWIVQASKEIKGRDVSTTLSSKLWDTLELKPFYTQEDLSSPIVQQRFHSPSEMEGFPPRRWQNMVSLLPGDTHTQILNALENGAEGLVLHLNGFEDLSELLEGVLPQYISIFVLPIGNPVAALKTFLEWADATGASADSICGGMIWTPSDLSFDQNESFGLGAEILAELIEMSSPYSNFKPFCIKTSRYTESGGNPLEALGFGLGELIELIDSLDVDPNVIFSKVFLEASVAENHFGEIARLKAFRMAFSQLASLYAVELKEEDVSLFCKTAQWSKSLLDPNTNLVRQTYEAMSAVLGGANWLWVHPLQEDVCSEMERRIARNVSSILREESYLDKVMDPAAGAYFLENLKEDILAHLKDQLSKMEASEGWLKALQKGEIHLSIRQQREVIQNQVAQNQVIKIGANKYPASAKSSTDLVWEVFKEKMHELNPTRATYLIELQTLGES